MTIQDQRFGNRHQIRTFAAYLRAFQTSRRLDQTQLRRAGIRLGKISKSLVEMYADETSVVSDGKNKGATFTVKLPVLQKGEAAHESKVHISADGQPKTRKTLKDVKIALVDDERDLLELLRFVPASNGAEVFPFGSAKET